MIFVILAGAFFISAIVVSIVMYLTYLLSKRKRKVIVFPSIVCLCISAICLFAYFGCIFYSANVDKRLVLNNTVTLTAFDKPNSRIYLLKTADNNTQFYNYSYRSSNGNVSKNSIESDKCKIEFISSDKTPSLKTYIAEPSDDVKNSIFYISNNDEDYAVIYIPKNSIENIRE